MPVIMGALALLAAVGFWMYRMRDAADTAGELLDMGRDVIGAAKRWNFRRTHNVHPVDGIDDARLAAGGLLVALVEMGDMVTREQRTAMEDGLAREMTLTKSETEELLVLGHWLVKSCDSPLMAAPRLARRLRKLNGQSYLAPVVAVLKSVVAEGSGQLTEHQSEGLEEAARLLARP